MRLPWGVRSSAVPLVPTFGIIFARIGHGKGRNELHIHSLRRGGRGQNRVGGDARSALCVEARGHRLSSSIPSTTSTTNTTGSCSARKRQMTLPRPRHLRSNVHRVAERCRQAAGGSDVLIVEGSAGIGIESARELVDALDAGVLGITQHVHGKDANDLFRVACRRSVTGSSEWW